MTWSQRTAFFLMSCGLPVAMILSTSILAKSFERVKRTGQTIQVKGFAEKQILSDFGAWRGSFSAQGRDMVSAYTELQRQLELTLTYLEESGVPRKAVGVSAVSTVTIHKRTENGATTNEVDYYELQQTVELKSADIRQLERLSKDSTRLIQAGVAFVSHPPEYFYTRLNDLKLEMLGAASKDARARAEQLAVSSGSEVGALRSAQQGVFQITPVSSTDVSDYGTNDTSAIEKSVKAVVTMEYAIDVD